MECLGKLPCIVRRARARPFMWVRTMHEIMYEEDDDGKCEQEA